MQRLEVSGAVRPIYGSLGVKRLKQSLSFIIAPSTAAYCTESLRLPAHPVRAALLLRTVVKETRCILCNTVTLTDGLTTRNRSRTVSILCGIKILLLEYLNHCMKKGHVHLTHRVN